jgi:hypothetical protein
MGLHAHYYPISPVTLADFITNWHSEFFWMVTSKFREEADQGEQKLYIGTQWHVLDYLINKPDACIPELIYAVRGHEFPAPDGSIRSAPHLPAYGNEPWQIYSYVTAEEVKVIAQYLPLIDESEFESRYVPDKVKGVYHSPGRSEEVFELLANLRNFYERVAAHELAILIDIG